MNSSKSANTNWDENLKAQTIRLAFWTFGWVATLALATFGAVFLWPGNRAVSAAAIAANVMIGLGLIRVHRDHLRSLDELQQRIYLESMGLALGIGIVAGLAYSTLDITNVIAFDAEIAHMVMLMGLTYLGGCIYGNWKFR